MGIRGQENSAAVNSKEKEHHVPLIVVVSLPPQVPGMGSGSVCCSPLVSGSPSGRGCYVAVSVGQGKAWGPRPVTLIPRSPSRWPVLSVAHTVRAGIQTVPAVGPLFWVWRWATSGLPFWAHNTGLWITHTKYIHRATTRQQSCWSRFGSSARDWRLSGAPSAPGAAVRQRKVQRKPLLWRPLRSQCAQASGDWLLAFTNVLLCKFWSL